jgi:hypothetical protein
MVAKRDPATKGKDAALSATKKLFIPLMNLKDLVPIKIRATKYVKIMKYVKIIAISIDCVGDMKKIVSPYVLCPAMSNDYTAKGGTLWNTNSLQTLPFFVRQETCVFRFTERLR